MGDVRKILFLLALLATPEFAWGDDDPTASSYHERLGVSRNADRVEIVDAYISAVRKYPDTSQERVWLAEAYEFLTVHSLIALRKDDALAKKRYNEGWEKTPEKAKQYRVDRVVNDSAAMNNLLEDLSKVKTVAALNGINRIVFGEPPKFSGRPWYSWSDAQSLQLEQAFRNRLQQLYAESKVPEERARILKALYDRSRPDTQSIRQLVEAHGGPSLRLKLEVAMKLRIFGMGGEEDEVFFRTAAMIEASKDLEKMGERDRAFRLRNQASMKPLRGHGGDRYSALMRQVGDLAKMDFPTVASFEEAMAKVESELQPDHPKYAANKAMLEPMLTNSYLSFQRLREMISKVYPTVEARWPPQPPGCDFSNLKK